MCYLHLELLSACINAKAAINTHKLLQSTMSGLSAQVMGWSRLRACDSQLPDAEGREMVSEEHAAHSATAGVVVGFVCWLPWVAV